MYNFYENILNNKKKVIIIFILMFLICFLLKYLVLVNYNLKDYLPKNSHCSISLKVIEEEFEDSIPNVKVMINNINIPEAIYYKEKIKNIEGVLEVIWLDDIIDISTPIEIIDKKIVENYYKNNSALFNIVVDYNYKIKAIDNIRNLIKNENSMEGNLVSNVLSIKNALKEVPKISIITLIFILIILILSTNSWVEPIIILIGLGVAIIINSGSNIIFKEISFITNSASNILQLAISLDYSIFLIHCFNECKKDIKDTKKAMLEALLKSTNTILSSSLTTIIGFFSLILMQFKIGADLGIVLGKGIIISLITVITFIPALILSCNKILEKTKHKPFLPSFKKFSILVTKIMIPIVPIFIIIIFISYLAANSNSFYYGESKIFGEKTKLGQDTKNIEKVFGKNDTYVLVIPKNNIEKEKNLSEELKNIKEISNIISYRDIIGEEIPKDYIEDNIISKFQSDNYRRIILSVNVDFEGQETIKLIDKIKTIVEKYYKDNFYLIGEGVATYDLMKIVTSDMLKVNLVAIFSIFIILLISMKSISLPVILVLCIETAIWINLSIPYFKNNTIFYIAYLLISSIQLGVTVDYAILFTEKYKKYRKINNKKQAIINTISSSIMSIITSGSVLTIVGFLLGFISSNNITSQLGIFIGRGALLSMIIVFFVLPGLLYIFDNIIRKTTKNSNFLIN